MIKIVISLFFLGLSFGAGPCLASCGPLLISYVAGTQKGVTKSIGAYFIFSFSRILAYLVLGLVIFLFSQAMLKYVLGRFFQYFTFLAGLFIVIIGLLIAAGNNLNYKLCQKMQDLLLKKDALTIATFGLAAGILPCPPFISVVSYIGLTAGHWLKSLVYSFAFGLGTAVSPLLLLVVFAGLISKISAKPVFYRVFNLICGAIIIFLGLQLLRRSFHV
ncbi:MAG: sulfite exporter TauE/SafE family protein [Candidatus Omnitrophica bacterium]|nr:sulfite exporter TauE/SafE family protein [Candidatus Omnitrophota bacterium]